MKIVYCTPSLYIPGGVERVLVTKANYFAEHYGYEITIVLTDGKGKPSFYPLSDKINVINLDINFEELWSLSFTKKIPIYLKKQRTYKKALTKLLMQIRPDFTVSLLRREINFLCDIKDGSKKIAEMHVNRSNCRNFKEHESNIFKDIFSRFWIHILIRNLRKLDKFVVLTKEDKESWTELNNVINIPNPMPKMPTVFSTTQNKNAIAVGRYVYEKGFDLLLRAWAIVAKRHPDWHLDIYGGGERTEYEEMIKTIGISNNCTANGPESDIYSKYAENSIFVLSSRFEGFGMAILEAMSCGVPVVSFACPCGPSEIIDDGMDGFLARNGDIKDLAEKICKVIENDELRSEMGKRGIKSAEKYKIECIATRWKKLFESLASHA